MVKFQNCSPRWTLASLILNEIQSSSVTTHPSSSLSPSLYLDLFISLSLDAPSFHVLGWWLKKIENEEVVLKDEGGSLFWDGGCSCDLWHEKKAWLVVTTTPLVCAAARVWFGCENMNWGWRRETRVLDRNIGLNPILDCAGGGSMPTISKLKLISLNFQNTYTMKYIQKFIQNIYLFGGRYDNIL